jgi:LL-diaminopimelate aminotransferase
MQQRYNVSVDPETEVQPLIGSKEGLAHLTFAYVTQGDKTIVPTPYYPVHGRASILAGGEPYFIPLLAKNNFLPDLDSIPVEVTEKAKLFFVNYPNNPTAAVADLVFYEKLVAYCKKYKIVLVSDLAYGEVGFDGYKPPSVLNVPGAKEVAVEFHSFSKTFNMAGWRCGFAVGNAGVIKNLYAMKTNMDYGLCSAIQDGAIYALTHASEFIPTVCDTYQKRRDIAVEGFKKLGWPVNTPNATMYVWLKVPSGYTSKAWTEYLLESTGVVVTPGHAFGDGGEGYFRISLVHPESLIQDALNRLTEKGIRFS